MSCKRVCPNLKFLNVCGSLSKVSLPDFKRVHVGSTTSDNILIVYDQNSVVYRFMSLNHYSILESTDAEFFNFIFPLKNNVPSVAQNNDSMSLSINSHIVASLRLFLMSMIMNLEGVRVFELRQVFILILSLLS